MQKNPAGALDNFLSEPQNWSVNIRELRSSILASTRQPTRESDGEQSRSDGVRAGDDDDGRDLVYIHEIC